MIYVDAIWLVLHRGHAISHRHIIADTHEELESIARKLGLKPSWIQQAGTSKEHYDLFGSFTKKILKHDVKVCGRKQFAKIMKKRRTIALKFIRNRTVEL